MRTPTFRLVQSSEAEWIAPALARLHLDAHDAGMALGLLDAGEITAAYRREL